MFLQKYNWMEYMFYSCYKAGIKNIYISDSSCKCSSRVMSYRFKLTWKLFAVGMQSHNSGGYFLRLGCVLVTDLNIKLPIRYFNINSQEMTVIKKKPKQQKNTPKPQHTYKLTNLMHCTGFKATTKYLSCTPTTTPTHTLINEVPKMF